MDKTRGWECGLLGLLRLWRKQKPNLPATHPAALFEARDPKCMQAISALCLEGAVIKGLLLSPHSWAAKKIKITQ